MAGEAEQLLREIRVGLEDAARDGLPLALGEPGLDLVESGGGGRSEVQVHVREVREDLAHALALVSGKVVDDDVDLASGGLTSNDVGQERDERLRGVTPDRLSEYLPRLRAQHCAEGQGPMPEVLESVARGTIRRKRQNRFEAIERLNDLRLVHAEDRGVLGRIDLETDDVCRLPLSGRVVRGNLVLESERPQASVLSRLCVERVAHVHGAPERTGQSVRRPIRRRARGPFKHAFLQGGGQYDATPATVSGERPRQSVLLESSFHREG